MDAAARKWLSIGLDILNYEFKHTDDGQLLSEFCDEMIERYPILARLVIIVVGELLVLHLANLIKPEHDIVSYKFWKRVYSIWKGLTA